MKNADNFHYAKESILGRSESLFGLSFTAPSSSGKIEVGFWGPCLLPGRPYHEPHYYGWLCPILYVYV